MNSAAVIPARAFTVINKSGEILPMFVADSAEAARNLAGSEFVGGWKTAYRHGYRVIPIVITAAVQATHGR